VGAGARGGPPAGARRLVALVRKEWLQVVRDPSSIGIAFLLPILLLFLFGYGVSLDARGVPIAIVIESPGPEAESFAGTFRSSPWFEPRVLGDRRAAEAALLAREVTAIVVLRASFERRVQRAEGARIQLVVSGVDANSARLIEGYVRGAWERWLDQTARQQGVDLESPVRVEPRVWYNPEVNSRYFLVPGLVAIVMTLIGALLTAVVVAREWERGTMEALLATPVTAGEILLSKVVPYFVLGLGGLALSVAMAVGLFHVPLVGSLWVLLLGSSLFLLAALGMGLLISTVTRTQFTASQIAILATFLPAFLLSGFIFDIGSMPAPVRAITYLIAARYYVAILQTVFLAGDVWSVVLPNALALAGMAALFLGLTWRLTRTRLD
jgi:ABC-2 type transport system permease protein